ncbi:MAG: hypothetical protein IPL55_09685 [Saprospiraceae bacterium]|nr:hypothetical protein [Saprospiraceae bacterium]
MESILQQRPEDWLGSHKRWKKKRMLGAIVSQKLAQFLKKYFFLDDQPYQYGGQMFLIKDGKSFRYGAFIIRYFQKSDPSSFGG